MSVIVSTHLPDDSVDSILSLLTRSLFHASFEQAYFEVLLTSCSAFDTKSLLFSIHHAKVWIFLVHVRESIVRLFVERKRCLVILLFKRNLAIP